MGIYVDEYSEDLKQYLNLSKEAWLTIDSDIRSFSLYSDKENLSGFLNKVFSNFYSESKASVSLRLKLKSDDLSKLFSKREYKDFDKDTLKKIQINLLNDYKDELIKENSSCKKGEARTFRINRTNTDILKDLDEDIGYAGSVGDFLRAVYSEYVALSQSQRERIFFKEMVDEIEKAIADNHGIKIIQYPTERFVRNSDELDFENTKKEIKPRQYYVKPYKLVHDDAFQYLYLIGLSEPIPDKKDTSIRISVEPHAFRLALIDRITTLTTHTAFISQENKEIMDEILAQCGPQYFTAPEKIIDVVVEFTKKGLETLKRISYGRPKKYEQLEDNKYVFHCPFHQALYYFWRFTKEAKIISPDALCSSIQSTIKGVSSIYN